MLDFDAAQHRLAQAADPIDHTEVVPLAQCRGRVLAGSIQASLDLPPADNSAMDGYAIRYADFTPEATFPVQEHSYAGDQQASLKAGTTIRLFTGSLLPAGADTVVMQEHTELHENVLSILKTPTKGQHVRYQGEDVKAGTEIVARGRVLAASDIALIASQGIDQVEVYRPLRIGLLTTGDELVAPGNARGPGEIYNSNGPMLAAMAQNLGAQVAVEHAADTSHSITTAFERLLAQCDLVLTVGGVSVGDKDLVKPTIESLGGVLDMWRVRMKPGRPVALAHIRSKPIVCLPGNPVSAYVVFTVLVSPLIRRMQGRSEPQPGVRFGRLLTDREFNDTREEFLRVQIEHNDTGLPSLRPHHDQGSAIVSSLSWAHGLARVPADRLCQSGDLIPYYDFSAWLS